MTQLQTWRNFLAPKLLHIGEFLTSQGITMAGNLLYGFLCVRLLPIPEYAKFVVVFGFFGTLSLLMDVGFSTALLPLVGERIDDLPLIADYVASLRQLAHWLFLVTAPLAAIAYPLIVRSQHWGLRVVAPMVIILLVTAWCARVGGAYGAVLIVRRDRKMWYRVQMISRVGALALLWVVWALHAINGFNAILINVASVAFVAIAYFFRARHLLGVTGVASREKRKAIVHFVAPNLSNTIFYAFQGQVSLLLITYFGHVQAVAGVGALNRLGQIFVLLSQMTPVLIEPYFARLSRGQLKRSYLGLIVSITFLSGAVMGLARIFPGVFLWILGSKYSGLRYEVFLLIVTQSISYISGILWVVHNARRFVYWWAGISYIILAVVIQIVFIWKADLSTVRGVLTMNLWTACAGVVVNFFTGVYGFLHGPRKIVGPSGAATENSYA